MSLEDLKSALERRQACIAVAGLGYVGLPLAVLLSKKFAVIGFDRNSGRVDELRFGTDTTGEVADVSGPHYHSDPNVLGRAMVHIVAVPTPVDAHNVPDLSCLRAASETVSRYAPGGAVVVYESTVYPGVTEDVCKPILGSEMLVGYSPERVNPGDKTRTIDKIRKVVAGETPEVAEFLAWLYSQVISAGVHKAPSIRVAEAAKVVENVQRDLNIALVNELSMLFDRAGIDTLDVLDAASTKWNFLPFKPGLVGGHCIGVDPYYLTHMADGLGFNSQVISAGRRVNNAMAAHVAKKCLSLILAGGTCPKNPPFILVLGFAFKEGVPDVRNSKVADLVRELDGYGCLTTTVDPLVDAGEVKEEYGIDLFDGELKAEYDAVILAVPHDRILKDFPLARLRRLCPRGPILDLKGVLPREADIWRL